MHGCDDNDEESSIKLDDGAVDVVRLPVGGDDLVRHQRLAGLVGDAQREGPLQRAAGVHPPDGPPRLAHRLPHPRRLAVLRPRLHEIHLHHVAVAVGVLHKHRQVVGVGAALDVEGHRQTRVLASNPAAGTMILFIYYLYV